MSRSTIVIDFNRFPEIAARLPVEASAVVRKTAYDVEADAKQKAPFETGNLRNSIQTHMEPSATEAVIDIAPNRAPGSSATSATAAEYGVYQEFGTRHMGAHPFMTPAAEINRPKFESAMTQLLNRL
jgi:HK97 gp10 family phage protein